MGEWGEIPDCFGTENKDNIQCGQCEKMHDCLSFRSIKIMEKMMSSQIQAQAQAQAQAQGQPMQIRIIPMEDTIKEQSALYWGIWKARIDKLIASGVLKEMMTEIQKQGFTKDEAFSIMIKII